MFHTSILLLVLLVRTVRLLPSHPAVTWHVQHLLRAAHDSLWPVSWLVHTPYATSLGACSPWRAVLRSGFAILGAGFAVLGSEFAVLRSGVAVLRLGVAVQDPEGYRQYSPCKFVPTKSLTLAMQ
eukprot:2708575-Rhodomonas_salina.1